MKLAYGISQVTSGSPSFGPTHNKKIKVRGYEPKKPSRTVRPNGHEGDYKPQSFPPSRKQPVLTQADSHCNLLTFLKASNSQENLPEGNPAVVTTSLFNRIFKCIVIDPLICIGGLLLKIQRPSPSDLMRSL